MSYRVDLKPILTIIQDELTEFLEDKGGFGGIEYLCESKDISDDTTKILIKNKRDKNVAILLCSYTKYSDIPKRNMKYSQEIKHSIGPEAGDVILNPILSGVRDGISYVVWPYCNPINSNPILKRVQLLSIRRSIFHWLRTTTQETMQKPNTEELKSDFLIPLEHLYKNEKIGVHIKKEVYNTIEKLNDKRWVPYYVLAHNDLWTGNILLNKSEKYRFVIIDWAGAKLKSFAISDIITLFINANFSKKRLKKELKILCDILKCNIDDTKCYVLSSFAYLGMNLGQFPENRYIEAVNTFYNYLCSTLES